MKEILSIMGTVIVIVALAFGIGCVESWLFMIIANWVLRLLNVAFKLTFWQSFGICLLLSFIGSFFTSS